MGEPMIAYVIGRVVSVGGGKVDEIREGDLISAWSVWSDYAVLKKADIKKLRRVGYHCCRIDVD